MNAYMIYFFLFLSVALSRCLFFSSCFFFFSFSYISRQFITLFNFTFHANYATHHTGFQRKCVWLIPTFSKLCLYEPTWMNVGNEINAHFYKSCKNVYCRLSIACGFSRSLSLFPARSHSLAFSFLYLLSAVLLLYLFASHNCLFLFLCCCCSLFFG